MRCDVSSFHRHWFATAAAVAVVAIVGTVRGEEPEPADSDPYPLPNCVVVDSLIDEWAEVFDEWAEVFDVGDREIRVCCEECVDTFHQNCDMWIGVVDEQIVRQEMPYYPLATN